MPLIQPQSPQQPVENQPVGRRERGTGFTNIQRLLGANVGAGQKMGSAIGQSLGAKAGQLSEDVTKAGKAFQDRYDASTGKQERALKIAEGLIPSSVEGISGDSGLGSMDEETAKSIGKQLAEAKTYQGPMGIEGASQLASRGASLAGLGQLARGGSTGQGLLLQGTAGKSKPYTRGQSSLDTFLLGQSKEAQKDIKQAAAQTAGAEQKVGTLVSGAEQQAKEGSKALAGRQADVLKKAAESGKAISSAAEKKAIEFNENVSRIRDILSGNINVGEVVNTENGNRVIDPQQQQKDAELLSSLSTYGIGTDIEFDTSQDREGLIKGLLSQISSSGEINVGGKYYTPEQQTAARNLALIQQDPLADVIAQSKFDTQAFKNVSNQDLTESQIYKDIQQQAIDEKNILNLDQNITQPEIKNLINIANNTLRLKDATNNEDTADMVATTRQPDKIKALMGRDEFLKNAVKEIGEKKVYQILKNRWDYGRGQDIHGWTNYSVGQLKNSVENVLRQRQSTLNKLNNRYLSKTSLKDYINKKFGINSQGSGQV